MRNDIYSAIGNAIRAKLIICLSNSPKNVTELIDNCGLSQSAVSQHLNKLKKAKLIKSEKSGKQVYYSVLNNKTSDACELMVSIEREIK